jgi:YD repeat-containing protein
MKIVSIHSKSRFIVTVLVFSFLTVALYARTPLLSGQSSTLLPDGTTLILGGVDSQNAALAKAFLASSPESDLKRLPDGLRFPRSGHTATVLPDGTVFIFGGVGADGKLVTTQELFDPATKQFSILPGVLAVPRAFHSAVVLTGGSLLLAGGITAGNQFPDDVQILDFHSKAALSFHALLSIPREGQTALLLSDGSVRISGGTDHFGQPIHGSEVYDPTSRRFRFMSQDEETDSSRNSGPLQMAASIPEDGATNVQILPLISMRFSQLLDVRTANSANFVLMGPDEQAIPAKVSAAESGRLVFVVPDTALAAGTHYVLHVNGATSVSGEQLSDLTIAFDTDGEAPEPGGPDFVPNISSMSGPSTTRWQQLPPLLAPSGATALAGQVLKLDGWPLENTTLEIDGKRVRTDSTGRFLLAGIAPGHHVLWIDGSTASREGATYGVYEVGATILPNKTNVLNYTIWMTRLDTAHAVKLSSPTNAETVITNPLLPGLELHLPAHTVITDRNGKIVRQVSITPVPVDKPPFPLPAGVQVPIYFTVQPGGAYIKVPNSAAGAQLIYPNGFNFSPGTRFEFWNYDAEARGWYIYGNGTVSPSARNIVPDPGVFLYEFTGAMVGVPASAPGIGGYAGGVVPRSDPVDIATGQFSYTKTDLELPDVLPIALTRTYIANDSRSRSFGIGASDSYDILMVGDINPWTYQELVLPDGSRIRFDRVSSGTSFAGAVYVHTSSRGPFYGAVITRAPSGIGWLLTLKDGTKYDLPEAMGQTDPYCQAIVGITDRFGNHIKLDRASATGGSVPTHCQLTKITSSNGRSITLTRDTQGRITQATDNIGRNVLYTYDIAGRLSTVTDVNGGVTTYTYDDQNRMLTIKDARNIVYLTNQYDSAGRVTQQTEIDTGTYLFNWTPTVNPTQARFYEADPNPGAVGGSAILRNGCWNGFTYNRYSSSCGQGYLPLVAQVDVTDPRGYVERVAFGAAGYKTSDIHALGQPEQQTETYSYYADNLLQSSTDALGRVTSFDYDPKGNVSRITRLDGTPDAVTTTFSYEPSFNQLQSVTDPLGHATTFTYDSSGQPATITDPLNHQITTTYNGLGQMVSASDPLGNTTQFSYFGGDLVQVTDPAGNASTLNYDLAGRVTSSLDAQGNITRYQYNSLNLVTQVTDPRGNNTAFSYDPNGNLLSLTDAANHTTSYTL